MIPEGWKRSTVADVSSDPVSYGVVQTGDPVEGGVPCVRVVDIANGDLEPGSMIATSQEISAAYTPNGLENRRSNDRVKRHYRPGRAGNARAGRV